MIAKNAVSACVVLFMCAVMVVLARGFRGISPGRLAINLLFPFSQLCIIVFLFYYTVVYELPTWVFLLVVVIGLLCGPVDLALFRALREAEERELSRERVRLLEEQLHAQEEYLERLSADVEEARRIREDVAGSLAEVDELLDRREAKQVSHELKHAMDSMDAARKRYCEHQVVDALVSMKAKACEEAGIRLTLDMALPEGVSLPSVELCAVFSNLLDNAIKACEAVPEGGRFIALEARVEAGYLVTRMENSCASAESSGRHRTAAKRGHGLSEHGWGLVILQSLAARHDGKLEASQAEDVFTTTLMLRVGTAA